jgi:esterase FrsA
MTSSSSPNQNSKISNQKRPTRYVRPLVDLWEMWKPKVKMKAYPFTYASYDDVESIMKTLTSYDHDAWAAAFSSVAAPYEAKASHAEKAYDKMAAKDNYLRAYQYYRLARYPTINSNAKKQAYRKSQQMFLKAAQYFEIPIERVEIPFKGKVGEGKTIIGYLMSPKVSGAPFPLLISWGGIDGYKEEQMHDPALERGWGTLAIDGPGVGDSPLKGSEDAERLFGAVFEWAEDHNQFNSKRIGVWGYSTGGYWAVKVAHVYKERIACAVSQGGRVHHAFQPEWLSIQERGEYPFEVFDTLAYAFGLSSADEWQDFAPRLSLLRQGLLDRPSAPLLLINGIHDSEFPIKDYYLLLEHGSPKSARFYDAGHMGFTKDTYQTIIDWISERLR